MSEAPKQVNLSEAQTKAQKANLGLSESQFASYKEYLAGLEASEKEDIMYLTTKELLDLKGILDLELSITQNQRAATDSAYAPGDSREIFKTFIQEQSAEGLSSADIMEESNTENLFTPELLESLDASSHSILFEDGGLFSGLDISPKAQDTVGVSLTFALLKDIKSNPDILTKMIQEGKDGKTDLAKSIIQKYNAQFSLLIKNFTDYKDENQEAFPIAGQGEKNKIFMSTETGIEFFQGIFSGEIHADNIGSKIQEQETEEILEANLGDITKIQEIGTLDTAQLTKLLEMSGDVSGAPKDTPPPAAGDTTPALDIPVSPKEAQTAIDKLSEMKPFGSFFAAILEALSAIVGMVKTEKIDRESTPGNPEPKKKASEAAETEKETSVVSLLEGLGSQSKLNFQKEALILELKGDGNLAARIKNTLESLSVTQTYTESFEKLFGENGNFGAIAKVFEEHGLYSTIPEGTSEGNKIARVLGEYSRYKTGPGVVGKTSKQQTWAEYAQERKNDNWKVSGK